MEKSQGPHVCPSNHVTAGILADDLLKNSAHNDDSWEDVGSDDPGLRTPRSRSPAGQRPPSRSSSSTSPRKRRVKTEYIATSPKRATRGATRAVATVQAQVEAQREQRERKEALAKAKQREQERVKDWQWQQRRQQIYDHGLNGLWNAFVYACEIVFMSLKILRIPIAIMFTLWLTVLLMGFISGRISAALQPVCRVPGFGSLPFCSYNLPPSTTPSPKSPPQWADYPKLVDVQSATFEQLLDDNAGTSALALDIKKAQLATSDLLTVVRVSEIPSRDTLADTLKEFVEDAKTTGRGLQKLSSKISGAVDHVMAVNDHALKTIESSNSGNSNSIIPAIWPFSRGMSKDAVTATFGQAMDVLSYNMERLILEAEINLKNLDRLEDHLSILHDIVSREDNTQSVARSELLSDLWTILGGNRKQVRRFDKTLQLLKNLSGYRKQALVHVVSALQTLRSMSDDMEDLRERVAAPELVGSRIPIEVHMKSIRTGLERLQEGRVKAKEREEEAVKRVLAIAEE